MAADASWQMHGIYGKLTIEKVHIQGHEYLAGFRDLAKNQKIEHLLIEPAPVLIPKTAAEMSTETIPAEFQLDRDPPRPELDWVKPRRILTEEDKAERTEAYARLAIEVAIWTIDKKDCHERRARYSVGSGETNADFQKRCKLQSDNVIRLRKTILDHLSTTVLANLFPKALQATAEPHQLFIELRRFVNDEARRLRKLVVQQWNDAVQGEYESPETFAYSMYALNESMKAAGYGQSVGEFRKEVWMKMTPECQAATFSVTGAGEADFGDDAIWKEVIKYAKNRFNLSGFEAHRPGGSAPGGGKGKPSGERGGHGGGGKSNPSGGRKPSPARGDKDEHGGIFSADPPPRVGDSGGGERGSGGGRRGGRHVFGRGGRGGRGGNRGPCYRCDELGHLELQCPHLTMQERDLCAQGLLERGATAYEKSQKGLKGTMMKRGGNNEQNAVEEKEDLYDSDGECHSLTEPGSVFFSFRDQDSVGDLNASETLDRLCGHDPIFKRNAMAPSDEFEALQSSFDIRVDPSSAALESDDNSSACSWATTDSATPAADEQPHADIFVVEPVTLARGRRARARMLAFNARSRASRQTPAIPPVSAHTCAIKPSMGTSLGWTMCLLSNIYVLWALICFAVWSCAHGNTPAQGHMSLFGVIKHSGIHSFVCCHSGRDLQLRSRLRYDLLRRQQALEQVPASALAKELSALARIRLHARLRFLATLRRHCCRRRLRYFKSGIIVGRQGASSYEAWVRVSDCVAVDNCAAMDGLLSQVSELLALQTAQAACRSLTLADTANVSEEAPPACPPTDPPLVIACDIDCTARVDDDNVCATEHVLSDLTSFRALRTAVDSCATYHTTDQYLSPLHGAPRSLVGFTKHTITSLGCTTVCDQLEDVHVFPGLRRLLSLPLLTSAGFSQMAVGRAMLLKYAPRYPLLNDPNGSGYAVFPVESKIALPAQRESDKPGAFYTYSYGDFMDASDRIREFVRVTPRNAPPANLDREAWLRTSACKYLTRYPAESPVTLTARVGKPSVMSLFATPVVPARVDVHEIEQPAKTDEQLMKAARLLHQRCGHMSMDKLATFLKDREDANGGITAAELRRVPPFVCYGCIYGEHKRSPVSASDGLSNPPGIGEQWCIDLHDYGADHMTYVTSPAGNRNVGARYSLTMVDKASGRVAEYGLKSKKKTAEALEAHIAWVKREGKTVKVIQADDDSAFKGAFRQVMTNHNIRPQISEPYMKEQNGTAEAYARVSKRQVRAILETSGLGKHMWFHVRKYLASTRFYSWSIASGQYKGKTPFEVWRGGSKDIGFLRSFGSICYAAVPGEVREGTKALARQSKLGILVGYDEERKRGYKVYDPVTRQITVRGDVKTLEPDQTSEPVAFMKHLMQSCPTYSEVAESPAFRLVHDELEELNRRGAARMESVGKRIRRAPLKLRDGHVNVCERSDGTICTSDQLHSEINSLQPLRKNLSEVKGDEEIMLSAPFSKDLEELALGKPMNLRKAMASGLAPVMREALREEWTSLCDLSTFRMVQREEIPRGTRVLPLGITFKVSTLSDPALVKVKARMHVMGHLQDKSLVGDTYAPTARSSTLKIIFALAAQYNWGLYSADIKSAFLHAKATPGVFVRIPAEFCGEDQDQYAELERALYGLSEAALRWNEHLNAALIKLGYRRLVSDPSAYYKRTPDGRIVFFVVHVDDVGAVSNSDEARDMLIKDLSSVVTVGTHGVMRRFLGLNVTRNKDGSVLVHQAEYASRVVNTFSSDDVGKKTKKTPVKLVPFGAGNKKPNAVPRKCSVADLPKSVMERVGSLRFLADHTRYDLMHATASALSDVTGDAATRVLQYLAGVPDQGCTYRYDPNGLALHAYVDASYNQGGTGESWFGYCIYLNDISAPIACVAKKITAVSPHSSCEAEHYGVTEVAKSILHLRHVLEEIGRREGEPSAIYCDNSAAIHLCDAEAYSKLSRHYHPRRHAIRQWQRDKDILLKKIDGLINVADIFTKGLTTERFIVLRDKLYGDKLSRRVNGMPV